MNVSLTPELEAMVQEKVKSGLYNSASEVVREALRLLKERDALKQARLENLRREIALGLEQIDRGDIVSYPSGDELARDIQAKGRERQAARNRDAA